MNVDSIYCITFLFVWFLGLEDNVYFLCRKVTLRFLFRLTSSLSFVDKLFLPITTFLTEMVIRKSKISNMCLWLVEDYLKRLKSTFFENFSSFFYGWVIWDRSIGKICKNLYIFSWKQVEFINMNEPRVCCAAVGTINYWENEVGPPHSSWPWNKLFGQL